MKKLIACFVFLSVPVVASGRSKPKFQDAVLVSYKLIPSGPSTPFDPIEQHIEGQLQRDYRKDKPRAGSHSMLHGLNTATGGDNRRRWEEEDLERQLEDLENQKSQYLLRLAQTGEGMPPCSPQAPMTYGCIKPAQPQYTVKMGKSILLLSPSNTGTKGNMDGLLPGAHVDIDVERKYVLVRVGEQTSQYDLLEASW